MTVTVECIPELLQTTARRGVSNLNMDFSILIQSATKDVAQTEWRLRSSRRLPGWSHRLRRPSIVVVPVLCVFKGTTPRQSGDHKFLMNPESIFMILSSSVLMSLHLVDSLVFLSIAHPVRTLDDRTVELEGVHSDQITSTNGKLVRSNTWVISSCSKNSRTLGYRRRRMTKSRLVYNSRSWSRANPFNTSERSYSQKSP